LGSSLLVFCVGAPAQPSTPNSSGKQRLVPDIAVKD
jgi:hypothetical protein